jgi:hypothetical protein
MLPEFVEKKSFSAKPREYKVFYALFHMYLLIGLLDRVHQIGVEFHSASEDTFSPKYFEITKELAKHRFVPISFDPNFSSGMSIPTFPVFFEIVFRKVRLNCSNL